MSDETAWKDAIADVRIAQLEAWLLEVEQRIEKAEKDLRGGVEDDAPITAERHGDPPAQDDLSLEEFRKAIYETHDVEAKKKKFIQQMEKILADLKPR